MNVDLRKFVQNFEPKPWMGIVVLVVMLGLLVLGTAAWIGSSVATHATAVETTTPTEIAEATPTATLTLEPTPSPTKPPIPIPQVHVVWTENVSVYLLAEPGKDIIASIPNGETIEIRTGTGAVTYGQILWRPVRYQMVAGWLAEYQVFSIQDDYYLIGEPGTSLFKEPEGSTLRWLNPGTPFQIIEPDDGEHWIKVQLPDESAGWLNTYAEALP